jgi:lysyl-tRNA synthetase class 1
MGKDQKIYHWTDVTAQKIIREKGDKECYTLAAGITPSGTVHIGNVREIMTVELVKRALEKLGKKVRFIYSWDDYDVFRKVPKNMPMQEELFGELRKSIVDVFDPFQKDESYARHHEKNVEKKVENVGIKPEFLYQAKKYRSGEYVEQIKVALENNDKIKEILNQFRKEPLDDKWLAVTMFCEKCKKDTLTNIEWLGDYKIKYSCECGNLNEFDFKKKPLLKLKWRVDWPMRWKYEQVDFEPGGKDHSTQGGSFDTGKDICKDVYGFDAPTYIMYDFIRIKGAGGKISSSSGNVITLADVLEVYEPEIARYLFAGTRPNREFAISFDTDVLALYEEFDKVERIYFGLDKANEKDTQKMKVAYELSYVGDIPKTIPYQPSFRHLSMIMQIHEYDIERVVGYFENQLESEHDKKRLRTRAKCAGIWVKKYAPEDFRFKVQEEVVVNVVDEGK